jgi:prepilin-type N-terminal cleavage/methylation domain-containing protein
MMCQSQRIKGEGPFGCRGLTLIELVIALALTAIIGGAMYQGLINQSRNFVLQDQLAEAQQNCRVGMENILREFRMAGYGMAYQDNSNNTVNDQGIVLGTSVTVINGTTLATNNGSTQEYSDALIVRRGEGVPMSIWHYHAHYFGNAKTKVTVDEKIPVRVGDPDYVLLITPDKKEFYSAIVTDRGIDPEYTPKKHIRIEDYAASFASTNGRTADYGGGTATRLKEIAFYISTSSGVPTLMKAVNGGASQVVARNIEDLQVAYQDVAGTWYYNTGGTPAPTINNLRTVRVNLVGRGRLAAPQNKYYAAALEDGRRHPLSGADGYSRSVLTSQVKVRNFGVD